jgi:plastocyanin domain-containing protein
MNAVDLFVIAAGSALILFIIWFFFGAKGEAAEAQSSGGVQEATVIVEGAYDPEEIVVKKGLPVAITFDRRDQGECTEWVVFQDLPTREGKTVKARLPEDEKTKVVFTPTRSGTYEFVCGMGMVHGKLIVKD